MLAFLFPFFTVGIEYLTGYFLIKHSMLRSENFLLEIFRDCCLLFNFQGSVLFFCVVSSTQLDYNITCNSGCQYLFLTFFTFFDIFFRRHYIQCLLQPNHKMMSEPQEPPEFISDSSMVSGEGGI